MHYFIMNAGKLVDAMASEYFSQLKAEDRPKPAPKSTFLGDKRCTGYLTRHDLATFEAAEQMAAAINQVNDAEATKVVFIAIDNGDHTWPRYDVMEMYRVGDKVSKGFNGDSYPEGTIDRITHQGRRISTTTGCVFWRKRLTGSWKADGTWFLGRGHVHKLNSEF